MPITLSNTFTAAMAASVRRPVARVVCFPGGEERELSGDLISWEVERVAEHTAGQASLTFASPEGRYRAGGERGEWLLPGTRVQLQLGLMTDAGAEVFTVFTGEVEEATARYRRMEGEVLDVRLLDRAGRFLRQQLTSPLYTGESANDILHDLFTSFGGLSAEEIALAPVDYQIPRLQFVEETLFDAGMLVLQAAGQRIYFDAQGMLRSMPLAVPATISWYLPDGNTLLWARETTGKPAATRVLVTGRLGDPTRQVGEEVLWEEVTASDYDGAIMVEVPFRPAGALYEEIRLEVVTALAPTEQVVLYRQSATGITVKVVSPGGRAITFRCLGRQVYYTTPYVTGTATDAVLTERFGERTAEYSNPAVASDADAEVLAELLLAEARRAQFSVELCLLTHPGIEPGDLLAWTHPRTGETLQLLAKGVTHSGRRGMAETTRVTATVVLH